eukprot:CAMPEP_0201503614 /NCGR_PEP_ID=MMETSP0151_2-20130828/84761_1 /ASSEMBLY_ACC=CAM_ASM_000257 /TAXON_ID=200890 /ORGANISM="Paramoeba atlantica, Strain 621/1 / CCAP 1560/9" /LENGTH=255 /DNA_ID=CAMNT_0047897285 /DNA_START=28 /DNA_END=792 /DNA_ORIENTATION=-
MANQPPLSSPRTLAGNAILSSFPNSVPLELLVKTVKKILLNDQRTTNLVEKSLVATSNCPDEINRDFDFHLATHFGRPFTMGGLAGFPFVGKTGFQAFLAHVPEDGLMVLFCSSHVGVDHVTREVGKILRLGMNKLTTACGSTCGALQFCHSHRSDLERIQAGDSNLYPPFDDPFDAQQNWVLKFIASQFQNIEQSKNSQVELPQVVSERISHDMKKIIPRNCPVPVVLVSGVQINVEGDDVGDDYFDLHEFKGW